MYLAMQTITVPAGQRVNLDLPDGSNVWLNASGTPGFHGLTGGVYKARERIHRAVADARLLANPASWSRVADSNPN